MTAIPSKPQAGVQRQIMLPTSKALEIAYKSIRLRLSRSLLVTSGIVLALAFLMSINSTQALLDGMRAWQHGLGDQRTAAAKAITDASDSVRNLVTATKAAPDANIDINAALGEDMAAFEKNFHTTLPVAASLLPPAMAASPQVTAAVKKWMAAVRAYDKNRASYADAQALEQLMTSKGVPTSSEDIAADRIQTRWLLTLALMVAFVGILNSMLMSVTERFREIGTMKCLGALNSFIIKLFLIESLFQGVVGTVIGIIAGLVLSIISALNTYDGYIWKNTPVAGIVSSMVVCLLVGVGLTVAGAVYPAWQAARMQPIEAMRVET